MNKIKTGIYWEGLSLLTGEMPNRKAVMGCDF